MLAGEPSGFRFCGECQQAGRASVVGYVRCALVRLHQFLFSRAHIHIAALYDERAGGRKLGACDEISEFHNPYRLAFLLVFG